MGCNYSKTTTDSPSAIVNDQQLVIQDVNSISTTLGDSVPENELNIDPFEMIRLAKEKEDEERIADFVRNKETPEHVSLRHRYELAQMMQKQTEDERLANIRRRKSNVHSLNRNKVKWSDSLNELTQKQENRYQATKNQTISQFRVTDGTGIVKNIVNKWGDLFMQGPASAESIQATLNAVAKRPRGFDETNEINTNFEASETFALGTTQIYPTNSLEPRIVSYLKQLFAKHDKTKHVILPCGVYSESVNKPPIDVCAAAIKTDSKAVYIALTIKASIGHEQDFNLINGPKKIVVFDLESQIKIMELVVDVVSMSIENDENQSSNTENKRNSFVGTVNAINVPI